MGFIYESHLKKLRADLDKKLVNPVTLAVFTQEFECGYCKEARELVQELASLSNKMKFDVFDFVKDKDRASQLAVDKVPAILLATGIDWRVRFYGIPAGYEFGTFVKDVTQISQGKTDLSPETKKVLGGLKNPRSHPSLCNSNMPLLSQRREPSPSVRDGKHQCQS